MGVIGWLVIVLCLFVTALMYALVVLAEQVDRIEEEIYRHIKEDLKGDEED